MADTNTRIYIANLGKYNEGELVGDWINLPYSDEEREALFLRIKLAHKNKDGEYCEGYTEDGNIYEEWAIHDYESDIELNISEYADLEDLNDLVQRFEDLDDDELNCFKAFKEATGYDIEQCLEKAEYGSITLYSDCDSLSDLAEQFVAEGMFGDTEQIGNLANYIDYEALGRDLGFDGYTETSFGVVYCD